MPIGVLLQGRGVDMHVVRYVVQHDVDPVRVRGV